jgi:hypothetical protein
MWLWLPLAPCGLNFLAPTNGMAKKRKRYTKKCLLYLTFLSGYHFAFFYLINFSISKKHSKGEDFSIPWSLFHHCPTLL